MSENRFALSVGDLFSFTPDHTNPRGLMGKKHGYHIFLPDGDSKNVGEELAVKIESIDHTSKLVTVSSNSKIAKGTRTVLIGDIKQGKVTNIVDYGFFVDIDGVSGLVHISEFSWSLSKHPDTPVNIGQNVTVKIIGMHENNLSLSLKQITSDPWDTIHDLYQIGDIVDVKVIHLESYGAFVELQDGIGGLIHFRELCGQKIHHPSQVTKVGQMLQAKIIKIDRENRNMALSVRALKSTQNEEDYSGSAHTSVTLNVLRQFFSPE